MQNEFRYLFSAENRKQRKKHNPKQRKNSCIAEFAPCFEKADEVLQPKSEQRNCNNKKIIL